MQKKRWRYWKSNESDATKTPPPPPFVYSLSTYFRRCSIFPRLVADRSTSQEYPGHLRTVPNGRLRDVLVQVVRDTAATKWMRAVTRRASTPFPGIHGFAVIRIAVVGTIVGVLTGRGKSVTVFPDRRSAQAGSGQRDEWTSPVVVFDVVSFMSKVVIGEVAEVP